MWSLIALLLLACLGVAAFIVGTVVLVVFLARMHSRRRENPSQGI
ncbi:hypothetical protein NQ152_00870 [Microbacterium sp. zg.B48]|nr:hypothetical protein [Microbacterium sp. zg.B48]MCR2762052.1 hypothetical protein [Microbacterium sp. zg.B48]